MAERRPAVRVALLLAGTAWLGAGPSAGAPPTILSSMDGEYATGGVEQCLECHDETSEYPVLSILATQHGVKADERSPMGSPHGCQSCHGPSAAHVREPEPGQERAHVPIAFSDEGPAGPQNAACQGCHRGGMQMNWTGSAHENANVRCATCHTVHAKDDPSNKIDIRPDKIFKDDQSATCFGCHVEQRALAYRLSHHPIAEGKMACSDCHNPHGSMAPAMLSRPTLNETCFQCHADKRGPFLWEHAPVREDCSHCHTPHGSNHPSLLTNRQPLLCQQCHVAAFHPSTAYTGANASTTPPRLDIHVVGKGCLNCHSEVHGSNHPSGPRLGR